MPRFVLLRHHLPTDTIGQSAGITSRTQSDFRRSHWDLMLEHRGALLTWAVDDDPFDALQTQGVRLPPHRLDYLDYEGPVSGNRGHVQRVRQGLFLWLDVGQGRRSLFLEMDDGSRWAMQLCAEHLGPNLDSSAQAPSPQSENVSVIVEPVRHGQPPRNAAWNRRSPHRRGVIGVLVRGSQFLVIRRSQTVRAPGAYCFPGGSLESGETDEAGLRREMMEELGLDVLPRCQLWESKSPWGVELSWILATIAGDATWKLNPYEVEWAGWLSLDEMEALDPLLPSNRDFLRALQQGQFSLPDWVAESVESADFRRR